MHFFTLLKVNDEAIQFGDFGKCRTYSDCSKIVFLFTWW